MPSIAYGNAGMKFQTIEAAHDHVVELQKLQIQAQIDLLQAEIHQENVERLDSGLTTLETEYKAVFEEVQQAVILLAVAVEYNKSERIINKEARKLAAKQEVLNSIKRKMFKICLKTGLKCDV